MSYEDAIADFISFMAAEGVQPVEPIERRLATGELIRFRCDGDGKGRRNGWAILYLDDRPAGAFGNYRLGVSRKWKSGKSGALTSEERRRLNDEWAATKARRMEERREAESEAARDARDMWASAGPASPEHPYADLKGLAVRDLRQAGGKLLVPMFDGDGDLWNLQRIGADGAKRFLRGGRTEGLFSTIGVFTRRGETCCIGEGYATMAAVNEASGYPCIVAFSAKNILPVARIWSHARPDMHFIICADDDAHLNTNIGLEEARKAAEIIGARVAIPKGRAA